MKKRKLFSPKDGTKFGEDIADIADDVKAFFNHLPLELKKLLPIAEDIVRALQYVSDAIKDGSPLDVAIQKALDLTESGADNKAYEVIKHAIQTFAERAVIYIGRVEYEMVCGTIKFETASNVIEVSEKIEKLQADTAIQLAVYAVKS